MTQLKERENQFLKIFEASNDAIIIYNKDKEILMANPVFYNFVKAKKGTRVKNHRFTFGQTTRNFRTTFSGHI